MFRHVIALFSTVLTVLFLFASNVTAQTSALSFDGWEAVAQRAELAVENGRASNSALETLREQVTDWRQKFLTAQTANSERIATLQSQVAALGTPADGIEEAPDIAARRAELTAQLVRLQTPVVTAEEAYSRADGIVGEIDRIIRERQTDELIEAGPSPLNPANWAPAVDALYETFHGIGGEVQTAWGSETQRKQLSNDAPTVVILTVLGLVLILRGRRWSYTVISAIQKRSKRRGGKVWNFLISLAQIVLPIFGVLALCSAALSTGLFGLRGTLVIQNIPIWSFMLLYSWWLGERLFPRTEHDPVLPVSEAGAREARLYIGFLAVILIVAYAMTLLAVFERYSSEARAVLGFPLLILTGLILFRFAMLLQSAATASDASDAVGQYRTRMVKLLSRISIAVALLGPALAALGYGTAAATLMFPSVLSLAVFGTLLVLQIFVRDLYSYIVGREAAGEDSLIPVLIGFALVVASVPLLALIWGARVADLTEMWTRFQEGFSIGDSKISPVDFITFAVIFSAGYTLTRLLQGAMRTTILPRTKLDAGGRNAIVSGIGYVGIFLAALISISSAGIDLSSLAIVAGALSVGIGFGLQNIVSNFVSGIILLIERPIAEGDWIEVGGKMGYVRGISVRSTRIETFDRTDVIVPNADLVSGMVTNWTRGKTVGRVIVPVGVAYGNDTRKIEDVLLAIAREHPMVLLNPAPSIVFQGFGADSLDFEIRAILRDVNYVLSVKSDMNHEIAKRFAEEGIEIPFAQRDIWLRNPEALQASPASPKTPTEDPTV